MRALVAVLAVALVSLRAAVSQGDEFVIRGVVMSQSRQPLDAVLQFADGSPTIRTDSLGEFRLTRSSRDGVRVTVRAVLYETSSVIIRPGRDSVVRIVLTPIDLSSLAPVYTGDPTPGKASVRATGQRSAQTQNDSYTCNFAKIKPSSGAGASVAVRTGAALSFRQADELHPGQAVYICDESGEWFKVYYSGPDGPCASTSKNGLDVQKAKGCRFGWVEKRLVEVISG